MAFRQPLSITGKTGARKYQRFLAYFERAHLIWPIDSNFMIMMVIMTEVTRILNRIEEGDPLAAEQLLPLVYDELRKLAAHRLANEKPGQTLQATALVHEAYIRLVGHVGDNQWDGKGHFFAAAAEAMRRILVESARRKKTNKAGGEFKRIELSSEQLSNPDSVDLVELNGALDRLAEKDPRKAELVKLRYFAGLTIEQAAHALGVSIGTANNDWAYSKAWLCRQLS
jgi:RNA polymerase sigma factor (TIGR02999 family)